MPVKLPPGISVRELQECTEQALNAGDWPAVLQFLHARISLLEEPVTQPDLLHPARKMTPPGGYKLILTPDETKKDE
jgi:hypothetical protein